MCAMATFIDPAVGILSVDGKASGPVLIHIRRTKAFRRAYPSKKPTAAQKRAQTAFAYVDKWWQITPPDMRQAWNDRAKQRHVFGYNLFQRVNIPRRLAGLPLIFEPPLILPTPRG